MFIYWGHWKKFSIAKNIKLILDVCPTARTHRGEEEIHSLFSDNNQSLWNILLGKSPMSGPLRNGWSRVSKIIGYHSWLEREWRQLHDNRKKKEPVNYTTI